MNRKLSTTYLQHFWTRQGEDAATASPLASQYPDGPFVALQASAIIDDHIVMGSLDSAQFSSGRHQLFEFCRLHKKRPEAIERFVKKWGMLGERVCTASGFTFGRDMDEQKLPVWREPLALWRKLSAQFDTMLRVSLCMDEGTDVPSDDWTVLNAEYASRRSHLSVTDRKQMDMQEVEAIFQRWFSVADIRANYLLTGRYRWLYTGGGGTAPPQARIVFEGHLEGPFAGLLMQLAMATEVGARAYAYCSFCRHPYRFIRLPKKRQRNFCPECRRSKVPQRLAVRDSRARRGATEPPDRARVVRG